MVVSFPGNDLVGEIHVDPKRNWTADDLGREVGLSRLVLVKRFVLLFGEPPMEYLTHWRLALCIKRRVQDDIANCRAGGACL